MPKIKLIRTYTRGMSFDDYSDSYQQLGNGLSDWEEVSEEDLTLLKSKHFSLRDDDYIIIEEATPYIPEVIKSIKDEINKQKAARAKAQRDYDNKIKERKLKAEKTKIEKAKKLLEKAGVL